MPEKEPMGPLSSMARAYLSTPRFSLRNSDVGDPRGVATGVWAGLKGFKGSLRSVKGLEAGRENPEEALALPIVVSAVRAAAEGEVVEICAGRLRVLLLMLVFKAKLRVLLDALSVVVELEGGALLLLVRVDAMEEEVTPCVSGGWDAGGDGAPEEEVLWLLWL